MKFQFFSFAMFPFGSLVAGTHVLGSSHQGFVYMCSASVNSLHFLILFDQYNEFVFIVYEFLILPNRYPKMGPGLSQIYITHIAFTMLVMSCLNWVILFGGDYPGVLAFGIFIVIIEQLRHLLLLIYITQPEFVESFEVSEIAKGHAETVFYKKTFLHSVSFLLVTVCAAMSVCLVLLYVTERRRSKIVQIL